MTTSSRRFALGLGLAMLVLPAAGAMYSVLSTHASARSSPADVAETAARTLRAPWPQGRESRFEFAWEGETNVDVASGGGGVDGAYRLSGQLVIQSLGEAEGGTLLSMSIASLEQHSLSAMGRELVPTDAAARTLLVGREAWLLVGKGGDVKKIWSRPGDPAPWKDVARALSAHLSMTVPAGAGESWTVNELTELGRAETQYRAAGDVITRERLRFDHLFALPDGACPRCTADVVSRSDVHLGGDGALVSIDEGDRVTLAPPGGAPMLRARSVFQLSRLSTGEVALASQITFDPSQLEAHAPGEHTVDKPSERVMLERRIGGLTSKDMLEGLELYAATGKMPEAPGFMIRASGLLLADPSLCGALAKRFARPDGNVRGRALTLDLLASAGSKEAQSAMREALSSPAARTEAAAYPLLLQRLSLVPRPEPETARFVELAFARSSRADTQVTRDATAFALGSVAGRLARSGHEADARPLAETLRQSLARAETPHDRAILVGALGSTRLPELVPVIAGYASDDAPAIRQAAAQALGDVRSPESRAALLGLFTDADTGVQLSALKSLGEQELRAEDVHSLSESVLAGKTSPTNDARLVGFLAEHPESRDDVRSMLTYLVGRTTDPRLAGRIRFVLSQLPPVT